MTRPVGLLSSFGAVSAGEGTNRDRTEGAVQW